MFAVLVLTGCGGHKQVPTTASAPTTTHSNSSPAARFILKTDACSLIRPQEARRLLGSLAGQPASERFPSASESNCTYQSRSGELMLVSLDELGAIQPPPGAKSFGILGYHGVYDPATHGVDVYDVQVVVSVSLLGSKGSQAAARKTTFAGAKLALKRLPAQPMG
jgi:hypothetical protein